MCSWASFFYPGAAEGLHRLRTGNMASAMKKVPEKGGCRVLLTRHYYEKVYSKVLADWHLLFDGFIIWKRNEGIMHIK